MSIRIQRCHPQVHTTHIDFTVTHSLKGSETVSFSSISQIDVLTLIDISSHVGDRRVSRDMMHDGSSDLAKSHGRGIPRWASTDSAHLGARIKLMSPGQSGAEVGSLLQRVVRAPSAQI